MEEERGGEGDKTARRHGTVQSGRSSIWLCQPARSLVIYRQLQVYIYLAPPSRGCSDTGQTGHCTPASADRPTARTHSGQCTLSCPSSLGRCLTQSPRQSPCTDEKSKATRNEAMARSVTRTKAVSLLLQSRHNVTAAHTAAILKMRCGRKKTTFVTDTDGTVTAVQRERCQSSTVNATTYMDSVLRARLWHRLARPVISQDLSLCGRC